jgi:hypothetical protein
MHGGFMWGEAQRMAETLKHEKPKLAARIADLEKQIEGLKAERAAAEKADDRFSRFPLDADQCARCWIYEEAEALVKECLDSDNTTNILRCDRCGTEYRPPL